MKLQVVKTDKGYVAISDEGSKVGDWTLFPPTSNGKVKSFEKCVPIKVKSPYSKNGVYNFKVIATDTTFKLEGIPQFELEDDIPYLQTTDKDQQWAYKEGYKAAQFKGCFTEEDIRKAYQSNGPLNKEDEFIDSLKQPKKLVAIEFDSVAIAVYTQEGDTYVKEMFKMVKSEEYPDGLLTIKQYYYE